MSRYHRHHSQNRKYGQSYYTSYENMASISNDIREQYVFLSGTVYPSGSAHINWNDQCFCRDAKLKTSTNDIGRCYPVALCADCDLNLSGNCPQENQNYSIPGV